MQCPVCPDTLLAMTERQGIEIDYCPKCRGIWLDRGELDKLIERSLSTAGSQPPQAPQSAHYQQPQRRPDFVDSDYRHHSDHHYKKRKSWLSDFFD